MTPKLLITAVATLLFLLLGQARARVNLSAFDSGSASNSDDSGSASGSGDIDAGVVVVHVLEKYAPFATAYQVGTYSSQVGWSLAFSFKAYAASSQDSISCFQTRVRTSPLSSNSTPLGSQIWRCVTSRPSAAVKNVFCVPEVNSSTSMGLNVVSYSENASTNGSLARTNAVVPASTWTRPKMSFEALDVRQWQQFGDLALIMDVEIIRGTPSSPAPATSCYIKDGIQPENFNFKYPDDPFMQLCVRTTMRSAHEYWTNDDQEGYITDVQLIEIGCQDNATKTCPKNYSTSIYQLRGVKFKDNIAKLSLSKERCLVLCYLLSRLVVGGKPVPSGKFLKSIVIDESLPRPDRITVGYNKDNLEQWPAVQFTDDQINSW